VPPHLAAFIAALMIGRRLAGPYGGGNAGLLAATAFVGLIAAARFLLPDINEVPDQFPAVVRAHIKTIVDCDRPNPGRRSISLTVLAEGGDVQVIGLSDPAQFVF
jgi:hypothetical protein